MFQRQAWTGFPAPRDLLARRGETRGESAWPGCACGSHMWGMCRPASIVRQCRIVGLPRPRRIASHVLVVLPRLHAGRLRSRMHIVAVNCEVLALAGNGLVRLKS